MLSHPFLIEQESCLLEIKNLVESTRNSISINNENFKQELITEFISNVVKYIDLISTVLAPRELSAKIEQIHSISNDWAPEIKKIGETSTDLLQEISEISLSITSYSSESTVENIEKVNAIRLKFSEIQINLEKKIQTLESLFKHEENLYQEKITVNKKIIAEIENIKAAIHDLCKKNEDQINSYETSTSHLKKLHDYYLLLKKQNLEIKKQISDYIKSGQLPISEINKNEITIIDSKKNILLLCEKISGDLESSISLSYDEKTLLAIFKKYPQAVLESLDPTAHKNIYSPIKNNINLFHRLDELDTLEERRKILIKQLSQQKNDIELPDDIKTKHESFMYRATHIKDEIKKFNNPAPPPSKSAIKTRQRAKSL